MTAPLNQTVHFEHRDGIEAISLAKLDDETWYVFYRPDNGEADRFTVDQLQDLWRPDRPIANDVIIERVERRLREAGYELGPQGNGGGDTILAEWPVA